MKNYQKIMIKYKFIALIKIIYIKSLYWQILAKANKILKLLFVKNIIYILGFLE